MDGDTRDNVGKALMSFTQQVGVPDEFVTNNNQNVSVSGTKWAQIFRDKDIRHMLTDPYSHWQNAAEESQRKIIRIYEKKRVQKGVPKRLFTYLINWCCDTRNATALETPELDSKTPHAWMLSETDDISHILMHDFYNPFKYAPN